MTALLIFIVFIISAYFLVILLMTRDDEKTKNELIIKPSKIVESSTSYNKVTDDIYVDFIVNYLLEHKDEVLKIASFLSDFENMNDKEAILQAVRRKEPLLYEQITNQQKQGFEKEKFEPSVQYVESSQFSGNPDDKLSEYLKGGFPVGELSKVDIPDAEGISDFFSEIEKNYRTRSLSELEIENIERIATNMQASPMPGNTKLKKIFQSGKTTAQEIFEEIENQKNNQH